ncbi:MAG: translation elongation factor Ts [Candidatus Omnitrophota bacterium]
MAADMSLVKKLREQTGVSITECKKAIDEAENDYEKAAELLRKKGFEKAKSKSSRATNSGAIGSYIHSNRNIGVMVEMGCETDFVAKNEDFLGLLKDIAMQIAAMNPLYISEASVPPEVIEKEKEIYREQMKESGKPEPVVEKIIEGKISKFYTENCLLKHKFFKDDSKTIEDIIAERIHKLGENIVVKRFVRYQVGEEF